MNDLTNQVLSNSINSPSGVGGVSIHLQNAGKKFNREWIFRKLNHQFKSSQAYAITGSNGSGKSTLLQCIAGSTNLSEGNINFEFQISNFEFFSIAAPYLELIEEMTAKEFLQFHQSFKPLVQNKTIEEILSIVSLAKAIDKQICYYSSGMKQRLKLAQAFFSDVPVILLDEPCTNLDIAGIQLYHQLIKDYTANRLVIVCSNDEQEINFCTERLNMMDWK
jgi:ABC-type multidrug transport system ATPase subunit